VVSAETMRPRLKPSPAIKSTKTGVNSAQALGRTAEPASTKYKRNARNKPNWMPKETSLEIKMETGTARRGKYTLPNSPALEIKVPDVPVRQAAK